MLPPTSRVDPGVDVPMPTLPLFKTVNNDDEAYESTEKPGSVDVAQTVKVAFGAVLLPMFTLGVKIFPCPSAVPNIVSTGLPFKFALYDSIVPVAEAVVIGKSTHET